MKGNKELKVWGGGEGVRGGKGGEGLETQSRRCMKFFFKRASSMRGGGDVVCVCVPCACVVKVSCVSQSLCARCVFCGSHVSSSHRVAVVSLCRCAENDALAA